MRLAAGQRTAVVELAVALATAAGRVVAVGAAVVVLLDVEEDAALPGRG